jgi:hypothetical protein
VRLLSTLAALIALVAVATTARAEPPASEADAERLFHEAKELMAAGQVAEACAKLAEAKRIEVGGGIILGLALCHAKQGLNATALGEFREALALAIEAKRADRVRMAEEGIASLESKVSSLTVVAPEGVVVRVNRDEWGRARLGLAVPMDGGDYEVLAEAAGKVPWSQTVHLAGERDARRLEIPGLADAVAPTEAPIAGPAQPGTRETAAPVPHGKKPPIAAYAVGGAGLVGLAIAGAFGADAVVERAKSACSGHVCAGAEGTYADAQTAATVATVAMIVGGLAVGTGAALLFTGRSDGGPKKASLRLAPAIGARTAGVVVGGDF